MAPHSKLRALLRRAQEERGVTLLQLFERFDADGDGKVDEDELISVLAQLKLSDSDAELRAVFHDLDSSGDGRIGYGEFAAWAKQKDDEEGDAGSDDADSRSSRAAREGERDRPSRGVRAGDDRAERRRAARRARTAKRSLESLRSLCSAVVLQAVQRGVDVEAGFRHADRDGVGLLTLPEFSRALAWVGFLLADGDVATVADQFLRRGSVDYHGFLRWAGAGRRLDAGEVAARVRGAMLASARASSGGGPPDLTPLFARFDADGSGFISRRELRRGLQSMDLGLSADDVRLLQDRFDRNGDGRIRLAEVEAFVRDGAAGAAALPSAASAAEPPAIVAAEEDVEVDLLLQQLRSIVRSAEDSGLNVADVFDHFDADLSGALSHDELASGLRSLQFAASERQLALLMRRFASADGSGLRYRDFLHVIRGTRRGAGAEATLRRVRAALRASGADASAVFDAMDGDASGSLDRREFLLGLGKLGLQLTRHELWQLVERLTADAHATSVDYRQFVVNVRLPPVLDDELAHVADAICAALAARCETDASYNLCTRLHRADSGGQGLLPREQLLRLLAEEALAADVAEADVSRVAAALDRDALGVDIAEFTDWLAMRGGPKGLGGAAVLLTEELRSLLAPALASELDMYDVFEEVDASFAGHLPASDVDAALKQLGVSASDAQLASIAQRFPARRSRRRRRRGARPAREADEAEGAEDGDASATPADIDYRSLLAALRATSAGVSAAGASRRADALLRLMRKQLAVSAEENDCSISELFDSVFDGDGDGVVDRAEFRSALDKLGLELRRSDVWTLLERFDPDSSGYISYREFMAFVRDADGLEASSSAAGREPGLTEIALQLQALLRRAVSEGIDVAQLFQSFDAGWTGTLSEEDFTRALHQLRFQPRPEQVRALMHRFGSRLGSAAGPTVVRYRDFLRFMTADTPDLAFASPSAIAAIAAQLRRELSARGDSLAVFDALDGDADGNISYAELRRGLTRLGFRLSDAACWQLMDHLDGRGRGSISLSDLQAFLRNSVGDGLRRSSSGDWGARFQRMEVLLARVRRSELRPGALARLLAAAAAKSIDGRHLDSRALERALRRSTGDSLSEADVSDLVRGLCNFELRVDALALQNYLRQLASGGGQLSELEPSAEDIVQELRSVLQRAESELGVDYRDLFEQVDAGMTGSLERDDFKRCLARLRFHLDDRQLSAVMRRFGGTDARIRYRDLLSSLADADAALVQLDRIGRKLRRQLRVHADMEERLAELFHPYDHDESGEVDRHDFVTAMGELEVELTRSELWRLMDAFDRTGRGTVTYGDFVRFLAGDLPPPSAASAAAPPDMAALGPISDRCRDAISRRYRSDPHFRLRPCFAAFDDGGRGVMDRADFRRALARAGVTEELGRAEMSRLMDVVDPRAEGRILYRLFVEHLEEDAVRVAPEPLDDDEAEREAGGRVASLHSLGALGEKLVENVERQSERDDYFDMRATFSSYDPSRRGWLARRDFEGALRELDLLGQFSTAEVRRLFRQLDPDGTGRIPYRRIVDSLDDAASPPRQQLPRDAVRILADNVHAAGRLHRGFTLRRVLRKAEDDARGPLRRDDFQRVLQRYELLRDITRSDFRRIMAVLDTGDRDRVRYDALLEAIGEDPEGDDEDDDIADERFGRHDDDEDDRWRDDRGGRRRRGRRRRDDNDDDDDEDYDDYDGDRRGSRSRRDGRRRRGDDDDDDRRSSRSGGRYDKLGDLSDRMRRAVKRKMRDDSSFSMRRAFERYDTRGRGYLSWTDFKQALRKMGIADDFSRRDMEKLNEVMDSDGDGRIQYSEFVDFLDGETGGGSGSSGDSGSYREGDKVEARFGGRSRWFKGEITRVRSDGTYDIRYEDGDKETRVAADLIRPVGGSRSSSRRGSDGGDSGGSEKFREGQKIEARFGGRSRWFKGEITRVRSDGTYDIRYEDGDKETRVAAELIRSVGGSSSSGRRGSDGGDSGGSEKFREGQKIEARFGGRSRWFKGEITRVRSDGTYDIRYEDGDKETRVAAELIRSAGGSRSSSRRGSGDGSSSRSKSGGGSSGDSLGELGEKLRREIGRQKREDPDFNLREAFEKNDLRKVGKLEWPKFRHALKKLRLVNDFSRSEMEELRGKLEVDSRGRIAYGPFIDALESGGGGGGGDSGGGGGSFKSMGREVADKLRRAIRRAERSDPSFDLRRALKRGSDGRGKMDYNDFKRVLNRADLLEDLSSSERRDLEDACGRAVDYNAFVDFVSDGSGSSSRAGSRSPSRRRGSDGDDRRGSSGSGGGGGGSSGHEFGREGASVGRADESVAVTVNAFKWAGGSSLKRDRTIARLLVELEFLDRSPWRSAPVKPGMSSTRFKFAVNWPMSRGDDGWSKLSRMIRNRDRPEDASILFRLIKLDSSDEETELGTGSYNLHDILDKCMDVRLKPVKLKNDRGRPVGSLVVSITAEKVLTAMM